MLQVLKVYKPEGNFTGLGSVERIQISMDKGTRWKQPEEVGRDFWGLGEEMDMLVSPVRTVSCLMETECSGNWPFGGRATRVGKKAFAIPKLGWGDRDAAYRGPLRTLHVSDCCGPNSRAISQDVCHPEEEEPLSPTEEPRKSFLSDGDLMSFLSDYTWFSKERKN